MSCLLKKENTIIYEQADILLTDKKNKRYNIYIYNIYRKF